MDPVSQIATPLSAIVEGMHYANQLHLQKQQAVTDTFQNLVANGMKQDDALKTAGALHGYPTDFMQANLQLPNEEGGRYGWRIPGAKIAAGAKEYAADAGANARMYSSDNSLAGTQYRTDGRSNDVQQMGYNQLNLEAARGQNKDSLQQHAADLNAPYKVMETAGKVSGETGGAIAPVMQAILDFMRQQQSHGGAPGVAAPGPSGTMPPVAAPAAALPAGAPTMPGATSSLSMPAGLSSPGLNPKVQSQNDRTDATNATRITTTDMRDKTQTAIAKGHDAVLSRLGQERVDSYDHHTDLMYSAYLYRTDSDFKKAAMNDANQLTIAQIAHGQQNLEKRMTPQDKNTVKTLYSRLGSMQKQADSADTNQLAGAMVNKQALGAKVKQIQSQIDTIYQKYGNVGTAGGQAVSGGKLGFPPVRAVGALPPWPPGATIAPSTLQRQAFPNQTPPEQGPPRRRGPYRPSF